VVEVSPPYDVSDNTVNNAHRVVLEALAGMAWRKRQAAGGRPGLPGAREGGRGAATPNRHGPP
jgi:agmatinase